MPSKTFFNLPEAKRERLLQAAREEFARVPYDQVSINKIIRGAEIPRGSFYMYFTNKEDLFLYMAEEFIQSLFRLLGQLLQKNGGDPFQAFVEFYDFTCRYRPPDGMEQMAQIFRRSLSMRQGMTIRPERMHACAEELADYVDWSRLSVRREGDKCDMLRILFSTTVSAMGEAMFGPGAPPGREHFIAQLDILKRGMQAPEQHEQGGTDL